MARWGVFSWVLPVAFALAVGGCSAGRASPSGGGASLKTASAKSQSIPVQAVEARSGTLDDTRAAAGSVVPVKHSDVAALTSGVVVALYHQTGDWVERGETVVGLNDSQLRLAVRSAQASLRGAQLSVEKAKGQADLANLTVQRNASLIKEKLIPQSKVDADAAVAAAANQDYLSAQSAVEQASAQVAQSELNLAYASIRAPFPGQLAALNVAEGEYVSQNTAVFVLVSSERQINFAVPPGDASLLPAGTAVQFNLEGRSYPARVSQAPSAPIDGVVPVVALFTGSFAPPYGTIGTLTYGVTLASGVIVPIGALQTNENQNFVFTVVAGKASPRAIKILGETGVAAAVTGIEPGSQVIVYPPPGLLDGSAVRAVAPEVGGTGDRPAAGSRSGGADTHAAGEGGARVQPASDPGGGAAPQRGGRS